MTSSGSFGTDPGDAAAQGELQLVVFWRDEMRTYDLPASGDVSIGRAEDNAVRIDDASVSRRHALLGTGANLTIEDLGGANGTFLHDRTRPTAVGETTNGRQIVRERVEIAVGDSLLFGTANAVVRHAPALELPDLGAAAEKPGVIVSDPVMRNLYEQAARAAKASISVLLLGETGVGKEVMARAVHAHSPRARAPFMGINCAALSESLLESELFGCEKGAFTGALQARAGLFEASDGGTVFLDEVAELPLPTQAKLLRVLEERVVTRLGATRSRAIDVRFVAATNKDLDEACEAGLFRQDLLFRLNGFTLQIPPLRERPLELELLVQSFLTLASRELERKEKLSVSLRAMDLLRAHSWPGNVRELRNAIQRAVALCSGNTLLPEHLPAAVLHGPKPKPVSAGQRVAEDAERVIAQAQSELRGVERERIIEALRLEAGNQTKAAQRLGISRRTLVSRLAEFDVPRPRKRD